MSKKKKKEKYRRIIEKAQQQDNIVRNNKFDVNLGIGNMKIRRKPEMESWPHLNEIKL